MPFPQQVWEECETLFQKRTSQPLAEKAGQHSEQFANSYFFRSSLFSCSTDFETTGIIHLITNKQCQFSDKNKLEVLHGYDSTDSHYTTLSESPWLRAEPGPLPPLQPRVHNIEFRDSRISGKCLAWTSAQVLRPKQSTVCWVSALQPSV